MYVVLVKSYTVHVVQITRDTRFLVPASLRVSDRALLSSEDHSLSSFTQ